MKVIKEEDFEKEISEGKVIVDFYATWCMPCRMMGQILERMESSLQDTKIVKVDVDECEQLSRRFGILSIPTIIFFKNGEMTLKHVGIMQEEEIKEELAKL